MALPNKNISIHPIKRIRVLYVLLFLIIGIFVIQLFYVQIIKYGHYKAAALSDQLKQYNIPASRGDIEAREGGNIVPLVLNQKLYTLYADPSYIKNSASTSQQIARIIGGDATKYATLMNTKATRYVVIAKKISAAQSSKILALKNPGIGTRGQDYRVYPDGSLASQLLGFVNDDGIGNYGLEQSLNNQLAGKPGQLKAITDANGVPLAASKNNIEASPKNGDNIVTTLDLSMQAQLEKILSQEYQKTKSKGLSAVIMDPNNGAVKAIANYPTYDPTNYQNVSDPNLYQNAAVTNAIEPGSSMKVLTTAAALDQGVIQPDTTFYDPAHWLVDGFNITDIEEDGGARNQNIASVLNLSLNTGATWMLMQMGGGQINTKARDAWYNYMTNHYHLGKPTGIEGYESAAPVPKPQDNGAGIDLTYANTSFGQGLQITALQMAAADSAVLNGGTYYQPHLVDQVIKSNGQTITTKPKALIKNVVSPKVSQEMLPLMEYVVQQHFQSGFSYLNFSPNYIVGGKTGTAQIGKQPGGGYYADKFNGTYVGFVGGNKPQYVVVVYNLQPGVNGYAGSYGGQPVFGDIAHMLIDNSFVDQKTN